jgi:hypothetical protein
MADEALAGEDTPVAFTRNEHSLAAAPTLSTPGLGETILTLDELMNSARRPERTARICLRPDLQADLDELEAQLGVYADSRGEFDPSDEALAGGAVSELANRIQQVREQMQASMRSVRVRAMPKDEWATFVETHSDDKARDGFKPDFWPLLVSKCAIAPTFNTEQVTALRSTLGQPAFDAIAVAAFKANTADGVDVPKSPLSSRALKRRG